jgi:hypothetical protein
VIGRNNIDTRCGVPAQALSGVWLLATSISFSFQMVNYITSTRKQLYYENAF